MHVFSIPLNIQILSNTYRGISPWWTVPREINELWFWSHQKLARDGTVGENFGLLADNFAIGILLVDKEVVTILEVPTADV